MQHPTCKISEVYRRRLQLHTALIKVDQVSSFGTVSALLKFELKLALRCNKYKTMFLKIFLSDPSLRLQTIQKLEIKIEAYRQRYFTQIDWDDLRAQFYIDSGLKTQLRNNALSLQMLCQLHLESPAIISALSHLLLGKCEVLEPECRSVASVGQMLDTFYRFKYHLNCMAYEGNDGWSYHHKAVKYGHAQTAEALYKRYHQHHNIDASIFIADYLVYWGKLPNYVYIDEFTGCSAHLMFEGYTRIGNIVKVGEVLDDDSENIDTEMALRIMLRRGKVKDLFVYDFIGKHLGEDAHIIRHTRFLDLSYTPLTARYLIVQGNDLPQHKRWCSELVQGPYFKFNDMMATYDLLRMNGVVITDLDLWYPAIVRDLDKFSESDHIAARFLAYLKKLDVILMRSGIHLPFNSVFYYLVECNYREAQDWFLSTAASRNFVTPASTVIFTYINMRPDFEYIFDLIERHIRAFVVDGKFFEILYHHKYDYLELERYEEFLDRICRLKVLVGKCPNYSKMFSYVGELGGVNDDDALTVAQILERRILAEGRTPHYRAITDNSSIGEDEPIKVWARSKVQV